jgi:carbon-monoxide dehydrogenase medium subunit
MMDASADAGTRAHEMTNTHLLVHGFDYDEPATVGDAVALLAEHGDRARVMAGGTNLIVWMKMEQAAPEVVINVGRLPGLEGIAPQNGPEGGLEIGALTTIWDLRNGLVGRAAAARVDVTALAEACASFGSTQIQLTGTIGGNVCNGSPASDTVPALMALGAELVLVGPNGERKLPIEEFLVGPGETALRPGELLSSVVIPPFTHHASRVTHHASRLTSHASRFTSGSAFVKISRVRADLAKASAAAMVVRDGDRVVDCRLALGAVGPTVLRARAAEELMVGEPFSSELALDAGRAASEAVAPIDDVRSSARYRRRVVQALAHDALKAAWERAGRQGGRPPVRGQAERSSAARSVKLAEPSSKSQCRPDEARAALHLGADERRVVTLTVNGVERRFHVRPNELLINVLRDRLDLTGTKYGCGIGECGACTVHVDGVPTLACLTLAVAADGREVTTVEGLEGPGGELDPLQEAFIDNAAFQCGYCTPGMLMMTKRLLAENPQPDEDDVRDYLKGNRCRCTGFAAIVRAVQACVEEQGESS